MDHSSFFINRRQLKNLTQARLGELLNYSPQTISSWESGRSFPELSVWSRYASILGVDLDSFIIAKEEKKDSYCDNLTFDASKFSSFLKQLRKKNNLTLNDLAKLINVNNKTISLWEKGMSFPNLQTFIRLCNLYKLNASELYFVIQLEKRVEPIKPIRKKRIFVPIIIPIIITGGLATGTVVTVTAVENAKKARINNITNTYEVTWLNYDGTLLEKDEGIEEGSVPTYDGIMPTKEEDISTTYEFSGWVPEVGEIYSNTTYIASFKPVEKTKYHIYLDPNGVSLDDTDLSYYSNEDYILPNITRTGYTFLGWFDSNDNEVKSGLFNFSNDIYLTAKWNIVEYNITYNLNGGTLDNLTMKYTVEDEITFSSPSKDGYNFLGWYNDSNNQITKIVKGTVGDIVLTAKWSANQYQITLDPSGVELIDKVINVKSGEEFVLPDLEKDGYNFLGWFNDKDVEVASGIYNFASNIALKAKWEIINYSITYNLDGGSLSTNLPTSYTIESEAIDLIVPTKDGNIFKGWYDQDNNKIEKISSGSTGNMIITAHWQEYSSSIHVVSSNEDKGTAELVNLVDDTANIKATPKDGCYFRGWFDEDNYLLSTDKEYSFDIPDIEYTVTALFYNEDDLTSWNYDHGVIPQIVDEGQNITYGMYPQTVVDNASLIEKLNEVSKKDSEPYYYYNEDYYFKLTANPANPSYKFSNDEVIAKVDYWFKVEPIKWNILKNSGNEYFLLADKLLDYQQWNVDVCSYELSHIRNWLNNDFYQKAFCLNSTYIKNIEVDNSVASTYLHTVNPYICSNTFDNVYLLSCQEYFNEEYGFTDFASHLSYPTDYTKALGIVYTYMDIGSSQYWTRSPEGYYGYDIIRVDINGEVHGYIPMDASLGVRPGITLKIS